MKVKDLDLILLIPSIWKLGVNSVKGLGINNLMKVHFASVRDENPSLVKPLHVIKSPGRGGQVNIQPFTK